MKLTSRASLIVLITVGLSCNKDDFRWTTSAIIQGSATYTDLKTNSVKPLPAGTAVTVAFKNNHGATHTNYSFKMTDAGKYNFVPPLQGAYSLSIVLQDTILQFSKKLVTDDDVNTAKQNKFDTISYRGKTTEIVVNHENFYLPANIELSNKGTSLLLTVHDDKGNPIPNVRICLFNNEDFYTANSPNCGGSMAYLETKPDGTALFTNLLPGQKYFFNARGAVGVTELNNHYDDDAHETETLDSALINKQTVVIKKT